MIHDHEFIVYNFLGGVGEGEVQGRGSPNEKNTLQMVTGNAKILEKKKKKQDL